MDAIIEGDQNVILALIWKKKPLRLDLGQTNFKVCY